MALYLQEETSRRLFRRKVKLFACHRSSKQMLSADVRQMGKMTLLDTRGDGIMMQ